MNDSSLPWWMHDLSTLIGVFGTLIGFGITLWQVSRTRKIAEAARDAALKTAEADRSEVIRFAITSCRRMLDQATIYVEDSRYEAAAMRCSDIADELSDVDRMRPGTIPGAKKLVAELRAFAEAWKKLAATTVRSGNNPVGDNQAAKWRRVVRRLHAVIDPMYGSLAPGQEAEDDGPP
jgi:hypothetical protein